MGLCFPHLYLFFCLESKTSLTKLSRRWKLRFIIAQVYKYELIFNTLTQFLHEHENIFSSSLFKPGIKGSFELWTPLGVEWSSSLFFSLSLLLEETREKFNKRNCRTKLEKLNICCHGDGRDSWSATPPL